MVFGYVWLCLAMLGYVSTGWDWFGSIWMAFDLLAAVASPCRCLTLETRCSCALVTICGSLGACGRSALCVRLPVTLPLRVDSNDMDPAGDGDRIAVQAQRSSDDVVEDLTARFATMGQGNLG